jgi:hypothetical protein
MKILLAYVLVTSILEWALIHMHVIPYEYGLAFQTIAMLLAVPVVGLLRRDRK